MDDQSDKYIVIDVDDLYDLQDKLNELTKAKENGDLQVAASLKLQISNTLRMWIDMPSTPRKLVAVPYSEIPTKTFRDTPDWEIHYGIKNALRMLWVERNYSSDEQKEAAYEWANDILGELLDRLRERDKLLSGKPLD